MTIEFLIQICERRIVYLQSAKSAAISIGDIDQISKIDAEITSTETTLAALQSI